MSNPEAHLRVDSDGKVLGPVDDTSYRDDGESVPMSMEEKASGDRCCSDAACTPGAAYTSCNNFDGSDTETGCKDEGCLWITSDPNTASENTTSPTPGDRCCYDVDCTPGSYYDSCNNFGGSDTEAGCKGEGCYWITSDYNACTETSLTSDQWIAAGWNASDTTTPTCASWKAQASTSAFDSNCQLGVSKTPPEKNSPVFDACRTICGVDQCSAAPTPAPTPTPTTPTPRPTPQYPQCSANGGHPDPMDDMSGPSYGTEWRTAVTNERHCNTIGNKWERPDEWPDPATTYGSVYLAMEDECIHKYMQMSTLMNSPYPDGSDGTLSQPQYYCKWISDPATKGCYQGDQCDDSWGPLDLPYYSPVPTPLPNPVPGR